MPANENEAPLSEAARDLDDKVRGQVSDLTDLDVRRPEKKCRNVTSRTRRLLSRLLGEERLSGLEDAPLTTAFIFFLAIVLALIAYLAVFIAPGNDDGNAAAPEPTTQATAVQATAIVAPTPDPAAVAATEPDAGDSNDEVEDEAAATYAPIVIHADIGDDDNVSSFYQVHPDQGSLVTPRLSGGTFDMTLDFEAMTVSVSFDLAYERSEAEDIDAKCVGSPDEVSRDRPRNL